MDQDIWIQSPLPGGYSCPRRNLYVSLADFFSRRAPLPGSHESDTSVGWRNHWDGFFFVTDWSQTVCILRGNILIIFIKSSISLQYLFKVYFWATLSWLTLDPQNFEDLQWGLTVVCHVYPLTPKTSLSPKRPGFWGRESLENSKICWDVHAVIYIYIIYNINIDTYVICIHIYRYIHIPYCTCVYIYIYTHTYIYKVHYIIYLLDDFFHRDSLHSFFTHAFPHVYVTSPRTKYVGSWLRFRPCRCRTDTSWLARAAHRGHGDFGLRERPEIGCERTEMAPVGQRTSWKSPPNS